jgi:hypothetical protein
MLKLIMPIYFCILWVNSLTISTSETTKIADIKTPNFSCDDVMVDVQGDEMLINNVLAPHANLEVFKLKPNGDWLKVFGCSDNCEKSIKLNILEASKYKVRIRLFNDDWHLICEKNIEAQSSKSLSLTGPCSEVSLKTASKTMFLGNISAKKAQIDVYKVLSDGSWSSIFSCDNTCGKSVSMDIEANQKYFIHIKMYGQDGQLLCVKKMDYTTPL